MSYAHLSEIGSTAVAIDASAYEPQDAGGCSSSRSSMSVEHDQQDVDRRHKRERGKRGKRKRQPPIGTVTGAGGKDVIGVCLKAHPAGCSRMDYERNLPKPITL